MTATITRFDFIDRPATEDEDERQVVRFFEKRKLIGEFTVIECERYIDDNFDTDDFDSDDFRAWIEAAPRTVEQAIAYLTEPKDELEADEEGEDDEEREPGSIVPEKYRILYGSQQNCGDEIALALTAYVTMDRATKKNPDGGLDRAKLRGVAEVNGIGHKLAQWEDRGLNGGLLRMNTSNVLRGMNRRGEKVEIGNTIWEAREVEKPKRKRASKAKAPAAE